MQNQGDFKLCESSTDVVKNFAVIKSVIIKRVHCIRRIDVISNISIL